MASDRHMEAARKIAEVPFSMMHIERDGLTEDIATALANAERDGMRRAAKIALTVAKGRAALGHDAHSIGAADVGDAILSQTGEASN